jgi:hypothetical protein
LKKRKIFILTFFVCGLFIAAAAQKIYWGNDVPKGWNGNWPAKFLTVPEKTNYVKTTSSYEIHEYIDLLKWNSPNVSVINMFTSGLRKVGSAIVMANPRIATPEEAKASGKPVIYLQGNIHPDEAEGKEALLMHMRDILLGKKKYLLNDLIIICCPCFNVDGTDTWSTGDGDPHLIGTRTNALNFDLNRDGIKLETIEVNGLYRTIFNRWDPVLIYDGHAMGGRHAYAIVYATSTVPAAHPEPRDYVFNTIFPALRESVRKNFGLETFTHASLDEENSPPTVWSHDKAIWTTEAKFVVSAYGLRNRMSILAETGSSVGRPNFQRRIYAHYALISEILDYAAKHGREMVKICQDADKDVVNKVLTQAESGQLKNFVEGKYESWGKVEVPAYKKRAEDGFIPGTSVRAETPPGALGPPDVVYTVEHLTKPVGTKDATVPRGYLIPADLSFLVDKLRTQNVKVEVLEKSVRATGEEFVIDKVKKGPTGGFQMVTLEGTFRKSSSKKFPPGTFHVDLAQPLANMAFYCLEPQAADGFVGWGVLDSYLKSIGADKRRAVYPVYKYFKILE